MRDLSQWMMEIIHVFGLASLGLVMILLAILAIFAFSEIAQERDKTQTQTRPHHSKGREPSLTDIG